MEREGRVQRGQSKHGRDYSTLTEALGQVGLLVDEDLGRDDAAEGIEGLEEVRIGELLREVVDEEVGPVGTLVLLQPG